jgi:hypothetical protein
MYILVNILLKTLTYVLVLIITNEAQTLLRLDVFLVLDTHRCLIPTHIIKLNYVIILNYYWIIEKGVEESNL